jgi:hypothetical protein
LILWDVATGRSVHGHRFPEKTLCAAYSPDGRIVSAGTERGKCFVMEVPQDVR